MSVVSVASAQSTLRVTGVTPGKSQNVQIALYGATEYVASGPQAASYNGNAFEGYCIDLAHTQNTSQPFAVSTQNASSFLPNGDRIARLVNQFASTVDSADKGAALQLAIWDILVDGGDGVDQGNFKATYLTTGTQTFLNSFLNANVSAASNVAVVFQPTSYTPYNGVYYNQGLIGPGGSGGVDAVPEPASMIALGIGGLALLRRRKTTRRPQLA